MQVDEVQSSCLGRSRCSHQSNDRPWLVRHSSPQEHPVRPATSARLYLVPISTESEVYHSPANIQEILQSMWEHVALDFLRVHEVLYSAGLGMNYPQFTDVPEPGKPPTLQNGKGINNESTDIRILWLRSQQTSHCNCAWSGKQPCWRGYLLINDWNEYESTRP